MVSSSFQLLASNPLELFLDFSTSTSSSSAISAGSVIKYLRDSAHCPHTSSSDGCHLPPGILKQSPHWDDSAHPHKSFLSPVVYVAPQTLSKVEFSSLLQKSNRLSLHSEQSQRSSDGLEPSKDRGQCHCDLTTLSNLLHSAMLASLFHGHIKHAVTFSCIFLFFLGVFSVELSTG